ncbi:MAG: hypothetical protein V4543_00795 [Bacteroidota bacterium]
MAPIFENTDYKNYSPAEQAEFLIKNFTEPEHAAWYGYISKPDDRPKDPLFIGRDHTQFCTFSVSELYIELTRIMAEFPSREIRWYYSNGTFNGTPERPCFKRFVFRQPIFLAIIEWELQSEEEIEKIRNAIKLQSTHEHIPKILP